LLTTKGSARCFLNFVHESSVGRALIFDTL
jgi:hypothetical protein